MCFRSLTVIPLPEENNVSLNLFSAIITHCPWLCHCKTFLGCFLPSEITPTHKVVCLLVSSSYLVFWQSSLCGIVLFNCPECFHIWSLLFCVIHHSAWLEEEKMGVCVCVCVSFVSCPGFPPPNWQCEIDSHCVDPCSSFPALPCSCNVTSDPGSIRAVATGQWTPPRPVWLPCEWTSLARVEEPWQI